MEKEVAELGVKKVITITKRVGVGKTEKGEYVPGREPSMDLVTVV